MINDTLDRCAIREAEMEAEVAQHVSDNKLLSYSVRGSDAPYLSGCVPRKIFQAEPESALARMYAGSWKYPADDKGRAIINSNPAHWPIILEWLSFGTVPADPPSSLVSECQYWQLDGLLAALAKQAVPPTSADTQTLQVERKEFEYNKYSGRDNSSRSNAKCVVLTAQVDIADFPKRLTAVMESSTDMNLPFQAGGRNFSLNVSKLGSWICIKDGRPLTLANWKFSWGCYETKVKRVMTGLTLEKEVLVGYAWKDNELDELMHPSLVTADGDMHVKIALIFEQLRS